MRLVHLPVKSVRAVGVIDGFYERAVRDCSLICACCDVLLACGFVVRKIVTGKPVMILLRLALRPDLRGLHHSRAAASLLNKVDALLGSCAIAYADIDRIGRTIRTV